MNGYVCFYKGKMASQDRIAILRQVKQAIRQPYAWPGGYPLYVLMADGEALSIEAARSEFKLVAYATLFAQRDEWRAAAVAIHYEDTELYCAHTNEQIGSVYEESL